MSIKRNYFLLCLVPLYFMIMGLCLQPWSEIMTGLGRIMMEPDFLITDYFVIGGPGAAFVNASLVTLIAILILYLLKMNITGTTSLKRFAEILTKWPCILRHPLWRRSGRRKAAEN